MQLFTWRKWGSAQRSRVITITQLHDRAAQAQPYVTEAGALFPICHCPASRGDLTFLPPCLSHYDRLYLQTGTQISPSLGCSYRFLTAVRRLTGAGLSQSSPAVLTGTE